MAAGVRLSGLDNRGRWFRWEILYDLFRKNWYVYGILVVVALLSAFLWLRYTPPVYEARAQILLSMNTFSEEDLLGSVPALREQLTAQWLRQVQRRFRSSELIHFLRRRLDSPTILLYTKGFLGRAEVYSVPFRIAFPVFTCKAPVVLTIRRGGRCDQVEIYAHSRVLTRSGQISWGDTFRTECFHFVLDSLQGACSMLEQHPYQLEVYPPADYARWLLENVEIESEPTFPGLFTLRLKSTNALRARRDLAVFLQALEAYARHHQQRQLKRAEEYLRGRLSVLRAEIEALLPYIQRQEERKLARIAIDTNVHPAYLARRIRRLQMQEAMIAMVLERLEADTNLSPLEIYPYLPESRQVMVLVDQWWQKVRELERLEQMRYSEDHPVVRQLREEVRQIRQMLIRFLRTLFRQVQEERQLAARALAMGAGGVSSRAQSNMPDTFFLAGDLEFLQEQYQELLRRLTEIEIARVSLPPPFEVVAQPKSSFSPVYPRVREAYAFALGVALLLALCHLLILYFFSDKVYTVEDLRSHGFQPVLGVVHYISMRGWRTSLLQRDIFDNLAMTFVHRLRDVETARILLVTSSQPGEGKTFIALNLAYGLARAGQSVLLVEGDLRRSAFHERLGISEVAYPWYRLMEQVQEGKDAVDGDKWTEQMRRAVHRLRVPGSQSVFLDVLLVGKEISNRALELLHQKVHLRLLDVWCRLYQWVLVDLPPWSVGGDCKTWIHPRTRFIYVVRTGKSSFAQLYHDVEELLEVGGHLEGFILNGVSRVVYRYYGYAYSSYYYSVGAVSGGQGSGSRTRSGLRSSTGGKSSSSGASSSAAAVVWQKRGRHE